MDYDGEELSSIGFFIPFLLIYYLLMAKHNFVN